LGALDATEDQVVLVQQVFLAPTQASAMKRGRELIAKFKDQYPAAKEDRLLQEH